MGLCTMGDCELDEHRLPFHSGRHVQQHYPQKSIYNNYNYKLCCAFRAGNYATGWKELGWTPRIGGCVWDATEANQGVVLRSELHSILFLLAHQLKHRRYLNHHTIPVRGLEISVVYPLTTALDGFRSLYFPSNTTAPPASRKHISAATS